MQNEINMKNKPINIIDIPTIENRKQYHANCEKYETQYDFYVGQCACCGKGVKNAKYFINTIYGGCMYPANDTAQYIDSWVSPVGRECIKRIPIEYIIKGA